MVTGRRGDREEVMMETKRRDAWDRGKEIKKDRAGAMIRRWRASFSRGKRGEWNGGRGGDKRAWGGGYRAGERRRVG